MREKISACVICYNEEEKIRRCLESLTWCDEIVVIDSFSTDKTFAICKEYTDRVYQHKWTGYVGQRNLIREMARYEWVLFLDSDEEVSPELRAEIQEAFETEEHKHIHGYEFPRQVYYLGRWICHGEWYPDAKLRLFRKREGRSEGQEPHDKVVVNGRIQRMRNPVWHYTYDNIHDHIETLNRFSTISAKHKYSDGVRFRWRDILFRPAFHFFKGYFLKGGFLDGTRGFLVASACMYGAFLKYAKLWGLCEMERRGFSQWPKCPNSPPPAQALNPVDRKP